MGNASEDWYADPTGIHHRRYWDGTQWTARVADRFGGTAAHHLQEGYPPPGSADALPPPPVAPPAAAVPRDPDPAPFVAAIVNDDALPTRKRGRRLFGRARQVEVTPSAADEPPDLGHTTEADTHDTHDDAGAAAPDDALVLAAQVLERATQDAGFSWRASDMTIDEAINELPVDIADHTVAVMHRLFSTAGDDENAKWTEAKRHEIKLLKRGYRRLHELVMATSSDELLAKTRAYGVPDDLTADFVEGILGSEIPTVAELQAAHLPVDDSSV